MRGDGVRFDFRRGLFRSNLAFFFLAAAVCTGCSCKRKRSGATGCSYRHESVAGLLKCGQASLCFRDGTRLDHHALLACCLCRKLCVHLRAIPTTEDADAAICVWRRRAAWIERKHEASWRNRVPFVMTNRAPSRTGCAKKQFIILNITSCDPTSRRLKPFPAPSQGMPTQALRLHLTQHTLDGTE